MQCDMCGKEDKLFVTSIEGSQLQLCKGCSVYGKIIHKVRPPAQPHFKQKQRVIDTEEIIRRIVPDYANKIRNARDQMGLKQEQFAKKINEKESIIQQLETGKFEPSIRLATKLEKTFNIVLIEELKSKEMPKFTQTKSKEGLTVGDMIKFKK